MLLLGIVGIAGANTTPTAVPEPGVADESAADDSTTSSGSIVVYEVLGDGTAMNVTYMKEGFSQEQQTSADLPFRKELQFTEHIGAISPLSLVAQNGDSPGDITCRITVDGAVVGESTSSGEYAVVTCNGNG